jgi:phosphotransferase system HPr-like phosphotransfer protein
MLMQYPSCDITFREKSRIFSEDYLRCCRFLIQTRNVLSKKFYAKLISSSHLLEDFLDYHGARNNREWYFYRELCAAARHLGKSGYYQRHITNRLPFYDLENTEEFETDGQATNTFLQQCLQKLAPVILSEAARLQISLPEDEDRDSDFPSIVSVEMLPQDIEDTEKNGRRKQLVKVTSTFLEISDQFNHFGRQEKTAPASFADLVPHRINEVEIRRFEMQIHNLQSQFDTYVTAAGQCIENPCLKSFRGYLSVIYHLFQIAGSLLHFYERHLHLQEESTKNRYKEVRDRLAELIEPTSLIEHTLNYALFHASRFFRNGHRLARQILDENIERTVIRVKIPQNRGFHTRPSLMVAKIVQYYGGQVTLRVGAGEFDAGSVLDIQWAGGKIQEENIDHVVFEGDARALRDIELLAEVNYGENLMGEGVPLPRELRYLRE